MASSTRELGNSLFKSGAFWKAKEVYQDALSACTQVDEQIALLNNLSACFLKLQEYEEALTTANEAIGLKDRGTIASLQKSLFRRAVALQALQQLERAQKDLVEAHRLQPDTATEEQLRVVKNLLFHKKFSEAIATTTDLLTRDTVEKLRVAELYTGPAIPEGAEITKEFVSETLLPFLRTSVLPEKYFLRLALKAMQLLEAESTIESISIPESETLIVCGDVHGQYEDLLRLWSVAGYPAENRSFLFNGDFVDRGTKSIEVLTALFAWKCAIPKKFHLNRGNHEFRHLNVVYGFLQEVERRYGRTTFDLVIQAFPALPLGHLIGGQVLVVHGGLPADNRVTLDSLRSFDRRCLNGPSEEGKFTSPLEEAATCLLWSDPITDGSQGVKTSQRGVGVLFGEDVTRRFLDANNLCKLLLFLTSP